MNYLEYVENPGGYPVGSIFVDTDMKAVQRVDTDLFVWTDGDSASLAGVAEDIAEARYQFRLVYAPGHERLDSSL